MIAEETERQAPCPSKPLEELRRVKARHEAELMDKANVVSVGIGFRQQGNRPTDELAIVVSVTQKVPRSALAPEDRIPEEIEGVIVDVQALGELQALGSSAV